MAVSKPLRHVYSTGYQLELLKRTMCDHLNQSWPGSLVLALFLEANVSLPAKTIWMVASFVHRRWGRRTVCKRLRGFKITEWPGGIPEQRARVVERGGSQRRTERPTEQGKASRFGDPAGPTEGFREITVGPQEKVRNVRRGRAHVQRGEDNNLEVRGVAVSLLQPSTCAGNLGISGFAREPKSRESCALTARVKRPRASSVRRF